MVPKKPLIKGMVCWTRPLKYWVLGASQNAGAICKVDTTKGCTNLCQLYRALVGSNSRSPQFGILMLLNSVDSRTLMWMCCLDPPRGLGTLRLKTDLKADLMRLLRF